MSFFVYPKLKHFNVNCIYWSGRHLALHRYFQKIIYVNISIYEYVLLYVLITKMCKDNDSRAQFVVVL